MFNEVGFYIYCTLSDLFFCLVVFFNKRFSFVLVILLTFFIDFNLKNSVICVMFKQISYSINVF